MATFSFQKDQALPCIKRLQSKPILFVQISFPQWDVFSTRRIILSEPLLIN